MAEEEKQASVPYFIHEGMVSRMERIIRMLTKALIIVVAVVLTLFIVNNIVWMKYMNAQMSEQIIEKVYDTGIHEQSDQDTD